MYNSITEQKIKNIPSIGGIDVKRLPQELTRIYAQIVSLRQSINEGKLSFQDPELISNIKFLRQLSINLETILLAQPEHEQKESIAFVAATAYSLIFKIESKQLNPNELFEFNSISPYISAVLLFLIANSQPDACEIANYLKSEGLSSIQKNLINNIVALASGKLTEKVSTIKEEELINQFDIEETAVNLLWFELSRGIYSMLESLSNNKERSKIKHFKKVVELSIATNPKFGSNSSFAGPFRLAKLFEITESNIFDKSIFNISIPKGVDPTPWNIFLEEMAKDRPYLWENHKSVIDAGYLESGISSILTLPTGAGKSTLSELKIASCLFSGKRSIYLVPTHALEDQINKNLRKQFKLTTSNFEFDSEYTELEDFSEFPVTVMTPEKCLTILNTNEDFFKGVGLVVFDEFHLINGKDVKKDRRSLDAMFCLLSLFTLIPSADYLLISAMVENGEEISEWIKAVTKHECYLFNSSWKPTRQMHGCLVFDHSKITELNRAIHAEKIKRLTKLPSSKLKATLLAEPECIFSMKNIWETTNDKDYFRTKILDRNVRLGISVNKSNNSWYLTSNRNEVAAELALYFENLNLKTLVFVDNPIVSNSTAKLISERGSDHSAAYSEFLNQNENLVKCLTQELGDFRHSYFSTFHNVAVHHGQLLPQERHLTEQYFKSSKGSNVLIATATLAQGINLPAEIVIIAGDDRFDEDENTREKVQPHELLNAAGRAGRAGLSSQGAVILIPGDVVSIDELTISRRWWDLKKEVFSKGDQCLKIDDPLSFYLDSLEMNADKLDNAQVSILYKFKSEKLPIKDTDKLIKNSLYAFKASKEGNEEKLSRQINLLIKKRNELDKESEDIEWSRILSYKLGVDPGIILELNKAIDSEVFDIFNSYTVIEFIKWFFNWIKSDESYLERVFVRVNSVNNIKKVIGLKYGEQYSSKEIISRLDVLQNILIHYVEGKPLCLINEEIPDSGRKDSTPYLKKARGFVLKLIPDISFAFGIITMIVIEKARQKEIEKSSLPITIKVLASCIREGFDTPEKLYFKKVQKTAMRVETHLLYKELNS